MTHITTRNNVDIYHVLTNEFGIRVYAAYHNDHQVYRGVDMGEAVATANNINGELTRNPVIDPL
jgi:hypothetical protein